MKKFFTKGVTLLLLSALCVGFIAGCKKQEAEEAETQDTTPVTDEFEKDDLPENLNYDGRKVSIFTWSEVLDVDFASELQGNIVNDQTYRSRKNVESRLNIEFEIISESGNWDNRAKFIEALDNRMLGGQSYDVVGQYTPAASLGAMKGLYSNLNDAEYLNFSKPWWPGNIKESCSIGGNVYFCSGDITATCINAIGMISVNLDMMKDYGIEENIYDVVNNGEWTMEKMKTMFLGVAGTEAGGNATDKVYGITMENRGVYDNLFFSGGLRFIEHDNEDQLIISSDLTGEKMTNWYNTCRDLLHQNPDVVSATIETDLNIENTFIAEKSLMFMSQELNDVKDYLKDADFEFAVVPYPMYDENQESYYSMTGFWVTMFSIPNNAPDQELSGIVLEALGSDAYRNLTPTVYTDSFQYRFLETPANAAMLDLIHDSIVYDTGRIFADDMKFFNIFRQSHEAVHEWSALLEESRTLWRSNIDKVTVKLG